MQQYLAVCELLMKKVADAWVASIGPWYIQRQTEPRAFRLPAVAPQKSLLHLAADVRLGFLTRATR